MTDCIFCKIVSGELPSTKVYEDEHVLGFNTIAPQAPVHILVIPKHHIGSASETTADTSALIAKCFEAIAKIANTEGLGKGFRVITNSGADAGQSVHHLHFHILAGVKMSEGLL